MSKVYHNLLSDLEILRLPIEEVEVEFRPFSKTYYGRYFPVKKDSNIKPKIFVYPYSDNKGNLLPYDIILETAIHEFIHHLQHSNPNFKRRKGVMHDYNFWKLYNHYINRAVKFRFLSKEIIDSEKCLG